MTEQWEYDPKFRWWSENSHRLDYGLQEKINRLNPLFQELDANGALGEKMLEVGSGTNSPLNYLINPTIPNRVMLGIDAVDLSRTSSPAKMLRYDVREIAKPWTRATRKAIVEAAHKLGIEAPFPKEPQLDTIFFFEILNYVDYQSVIKSYASFLKPGGKIIILNHPQRHPPQSIMKGFGKGAQDRAESSDPNPLFDARGAKSNIELAQFIGENFDIEKGYPKYPWGLEEAIGQTPGEDLTLMFLVARKR